MQLRLLCAAIVCTGLLLSACTTAQKGKTASSVNDEALEQFEALMVGTYNSEAQSKRDTDYFNISLVMVPIWADRTDGKWLYVEQAVASNLDKPYRQRVYHLEHPRKNVFTSEVFTIKDAMSYAGAQRDAAKMQNLTYDQIELKDGCTVTLVKKGMVYEGGTDADKCPSELRGAKYATTNILLKAGELHSWDQGFDAAGKQVWGATKGGYVFIKQ